MRQLVLRAVLLTVVSTAALLVVPLGIALSARIEAGADQELERVALTAAFGIGSAFAAGDPVDVPSDERHIVGLYSTAGDRIGGLGPAHASRVPDLVSHTRVSWFDVDGARVVLVPVVQNERVVAIVRAERSHGSAAAAIGLLWIALLGLAGVVCVAGAAVALRTSRRLADPVEALAADVAGLAEPEHRMPSRSSGVAEVEVVRAALAVASDRLAVLLERERRLAGDTSHQLRTPLAGLRNRLELALDGSSPAEDAIRGSIAEVDRMDVIITNLLAMVREPIDEHSTEAASEVVRGAVERWRERVAAAGRELEARANDDSLVAARAVGVVLDVLLENAVQHGRGRISVHAERRVGSTALIVADGGVYDGPTDPFTERTHTNGHGHGLPLAARAAEIARGRLVLLPGSATAFALLLPIDA